MGVMSVGRHTRPACNQALRGSLKLCQECGFNSCVCVFFILWRSRGQKQWVVTSISHMGEMRDSDWSRPNLLRSDWLGPQCSHYDYYCVCHLLVRAPCHVLFQTLLLNFIADIFNKFCCESNKI